MAKGGYRKAWDAVRKNAKLDGVRFHDIRRSIASIAFESGESKHVVGAMLGHKDASTTERIYATISDEAQRAVAARSAKAWTEAAK
jgi:integrase